MAPIKSTKFGYMSIFTDKVETDNNIAGIGATYTTTEVFEPGNGYRYLIYTAPGYLNVNRGGSVDLLVVGGGGAGGQGEYYPPTSYYAGGGGGAGGYFQDFNFTLPIGEYDISIGDGGAVAPQPTNEQLGLNRNASPGTPSYISGPGITTIIAYGGGGGGGGYDFSSPPPTTYTAGDGSDGGSGGGCSSTNPGTVSVGLGNSTTAIAPARGSTIPAYLQGSGAVQGYPGFGGDNPFLTSGGGGGAGAAGVGGPSHNGGDGRAAWTNDDGIPPSYGTPGPTPGRWFAGGGGGCSPSLAIPGGNNNGGAGGGGRGADQSPPTFVQGAVAGTVNTGGGGGGGHGSGATYAAKAGGSGIVIIRYKIS